MAKGDPGASGGVASQGQTPKIDQYSVMHKLMDVLGASDGGSIAPSGNKQMPMPMARDNSLAGGDGGTMGGPPPQQYNPSGGFMPQNVAGAAGAAMGGRMQPMAQPRMGVAPTDQLRNAMMKQSGFRQQQ